MRIAKPAWFRSIRLRLALAYSALVFALAAVVVGGVNVALSRSLSEYPVSQRTDFRIVQLPDGRIIRVEERIVDLLTLLEREANSRALETLRRVSLLALVGLFPASVVIGYLVADRALRPIGRINAVAREIQATDLSRRIHLEGPDDELKELADTFDQMLSRVEAGVEAQRRFVQDASHELRNPLAVMATNLDVVLADEEADADALRETAEVVRRTVDRTARTVDDLVLFARNEVPESRRSTVDLGDLVDSVIDEYRGPIDEAGMRLERVGSGATVMADYDALKRAFGNLVDNAVRLGPRGGRVRYGAGATDGWAWFGVADEGPGIDAEEHEMLFRRGWSRRRGAEAAAHSGLGLAIVRQVAESHGGLATVASSPGRGASFVVWIPAGEDLRKAEVSDDGVHPRRDPLLEA